MPCAQILAAGKAKRHRSVVAFSAVLMRARHRHSGSIRFGGRRQAAKQPVRFVLDAGRKVDLVGIAVDTASAGNESPEITNADWGALGVEQLALKVIVLHIEDIDRTVTEIPDKEIAGKVAKARGCDCKPPRRIERSVRCHA